MADFREADMMAKVVAGVESYMLHVEFESSYKSNIAMQKRMLRYYAYMRWNTDLPIYQIVAILKEPEIRKITSQMHSTVQGLDVLKYQYRVVKVYEMDKKQILQERKVVLYPLRIFMKHDGETEEEHIRECLQVTEMLEDKDYYFLTRECLRKKYRKSQYEPWIKEEIIMQSTLGRDIYEKGLEQGVGKGFSTTLIKLLTQRFGVLPDELKEQIRNLDVETLDSLLGGVMKYQNLEEVNRLLNP